VYRLLGSAFILACQAVKIQALAKVLIDAATAKACDQNFRRKFSPDSYRQFADMALMAVP